mgnify:CR=1 FL=1
MIDDNNTFKLKNINETIDGQEHILDFGEDEGKTFRYKEFSAVAAERFALRMSRFTTDIPKDKLEEIQAIADGNSNYDAMNLLMSMPEFSLLTNIDTIDFLNNELSLFEIFDQARGEYRKLDIDSDIKSIKTLHFLRTKLLEVFRHFFTKGNS